MGEVRPARPEDAGSIVEVLRAGIPSRTVPFTIFGARGVVSFLAEAIAGAPRGMGQFLVWDTGGRVDGFAELRSSGETLYLNHVYVHPRAQDRGLGRALVHTGLLALGGRKTALELEVFSENTRARHWYAGMGLGPVARAGWWVMPLPAVPAAAATRWRAIELGEAAAAHARYGFSRFTLEDGEGRRFALGLLGRTLRTREPALLHETGALAALAGLGLAARVLCIAPGPQPAPEASLLIEALRMRGPFEQALRATRGGQPASAHGGNPSS